MRQAFQTIVAKLGAPEVLVYNAGPGMKWPPPGILDLDPAVFSRAFDAGVTGALVWAQQVRCLPQLQSTPCCTLMALHETPRRMKGLAGVTTAWNAGHGPRGILKSL